MIACPACATPQKDGARFCFSCGTPIAAPTCSACDAELVPGARFCSECGTPQAATGAAAPSPVGAPVSARRVTSVLFGDLVGFTTLAEMRDHEETREILSRYFDECRRVIDRYGGTVEKFIGDAVMAVWGVPTAHEDDAERAVRAGLELVHVVVALGEELRVPDLAMRVGIVTGEVAVTLGAQQQGMVAGDAVNTAARVQSVAGAGQVWVDETTRLLTTSAITYADAGSHLLKGKAEPVPLWSVRAVVAGVGGVQRADGLEAPLIGRERELRLVKEVFHSVDDSGSPALLVLVGEPGVGKSRLAWEFEKYIDGLRQTVRWHTGRCVAYGEGVAYYALAEAIRARLRSLVPDDDLDDAAEQAELLERGLERYVPDEEERTWMRPRLGALLGITSVGTFPREDLFSAWTAFLERVGEGTTPVVLVIDDAHHADDGLLQFVEHLLAVGTFPCFVMLLARAGLLEEHPALASNRRATVSHLHALRDEDVSRMLDALVVGLPERVRDSLVRRAEGIPLFAVETVRSLIDRDLVIPRGGQYVLADPDSLDLDSIAAPASLQALISARLDALGPGQRRLVERASVIGNVFSRAELAELCSDVDGFDELLAGLVRQQLFGQLTNRFSAEFGQYQFVQSVVRQVVYGTLSRRDRRATHLAVARMVEGETDPSGELAPIIAQHYLDAVAAVPDEPDVPELEARAIAQLERAAARARSLGAMGESAGHLLLALERTREPADRARLESAVAWALVDAGDYEQAIPHAAAAVETFDELGADIDAAKAEAARASALMSVGDNATAFALTEPRWDALQGRHGADEALLLIGKVLVGAAGKMGQERRDVVDRRVQLAERTGNVEELADAWSALSVAYSFLGAPSTARVLMSAVADIAREHHLPVSLARCLSNLTVEYIGEDVERAVRTGQEGVEVADRAGIAVWLDYTEANLILSLLAAGRWTETGEWVARVGSNSVVTQSICAGAAAIIAHARGEPYETPWPEGVGLGSDDPSDVAWSGLAEGLAAALRGDLPEAVRRTSGATDVMYGASGTSDDFLHLWPVATDLAIRAGDQETTDRMLRLVDESVARFKVPPALLAHRARFAGLLTQDEDPESAEASFREALDGFTRWGSRHYRARAAGELGVLLRDRGRAEEAESLIATARTELSELGAAQWLRELGLSELGAAQVGTSRA